jgi:Zn-finger nucleic acid-binding protein
MNRACVKCTSVLDKSMVGEVEVDLCPSCGGLWLDSGELEKLGKGSKDDVEKLRNALVGSEKPEPASDTTTPCVACDGKLKEMKLGAVTIEFCGACHGIFLDKGELDQAIAAVGSMTVAQVLVAAGRMTGEMTAVEEA